MIFAAQAFAYVLLGVLLGAAAIAAWAGFLPFLMLALMVLIIASLLSGRGKNGGDL